MKIIYSTLLAKLAEITELRWIDKDKGQLEFGGNRPAVAFPCALIKIELPRCDDMGGNVQQCSSGITIRLAWNFNGETSAVTPALNLEESLAYYDLAEKVYLKLQGFTNAQLSAFSRKRVYEETRSDGLTVMGMQFETDFGDYTAAV